MGAIVTTPEIASTLSQALYFKFVFLFIQIFVSCFISLI
jgi:hypothetical protein